jgi:hypothetical protein
MVHSVVRAVSGAWLATCEAMMQRFARQKVASAVARVAEETAPEAPLGRRSLTSVLRSTAGGGASLPGDLRAKFEGSLGKDLGGVRVHTGPESAQAASSIAARAFTVGQDIHFGAGQYEPGSPEGERLVAHEAAHTVQQGAAVARQVDEDAEPRGEDEPLSVSDPGDATEVEADAAADAMVAGAEAQVATEGDGVAAKVHRAPDGEKSAVAAQPEAKSPPLASGGIEVAAKCPPAKAELGYATIEAELAGKLIAKPAAGEGAAGSPAEVKAGVEKDKAKLEIEKKLAEWGQIAAFKIGGEIEASKEGFKLAAGGSVEFNQTEKKDGRYTIGPLAIGFKLFEWEPGKVPSIAFLEGKGPWTMRLGSLLGHDVQLASELTVKLMPTWKLLLPKLGAALVSPVAIAATGLALLGAGFYDLFLAKRPGDVAEEYALACLEYARAFEAGIKGEEIPGADSWLGVADASARGYAAGTKYMADKKVHPVIGGGVVQHFRPAAEAWKQKWPGLKEQAREWWSKNNRWDMTIGMQRDYKILTRVLDAYDKGPYSEG